MRIPEKFMVMGSQRAGTVLIQDMISSHPEAHCWGEILLGMDGPSAVGYPAFLARRRVLRHGWQYVMSGAAVSPKRVVRMSLVSPGLRAVGFRAMYSQLRCRETRIVLEEGLLVIHVRRANVLRQYISLIQMRNRQAKFGPRSAHSLVDTSFAPVCVRPDRALSFVGKREQDQNRFAQTFRALTVLEIWYERDIAHVDGARYQDLGYVPEASGSLPLDARITDALGLKPAVLSGATRRTGAADLRDSVANFEELARVFAASRYAWMLEE